MKPCRIVVIFLIVAFLVGCAGSSKKMNTLKLGMTKQDVIEAIGSPDSTSAAGDIEYLRYRLNSGGFPSMNITSSCWMEKWVLTERGAISILSTEQRFRQNTTSNCTVTAAI